MFPDIFHWTYPTRESTPRQNLLLKISPHKSTANTMGYLSIYKCTHIYGIMWWELNYNHYRVRWSKARNIAFLLKKYAGSIKRIQICWSEADDVKTGYYKFTNFYMSYPCIQYACNKKIYLSAVVSSSGISSCTWQYLKRVSKFDFCGVQGCYFLDFHLAFVLLF